MSEDNTHISFIGQKVSKVCWCLEKNGGTSPREFYTGTYDESTNRITRWVLPDMDNNSNDQSIEPNDVCCLDTQGSITGLVQLSADKFIYSCDNGAVSIVSYDPSAQFMRELQVWKKLHRYDTFGEAASCTCIASQGSEIITGGEDGTINVLLIDQLKPLLRLDKADSSNITGLEYLTDREIVSINTTGQLKLWDIRSRKDKTPEKVMTLTGNTCPLLSVDKHPNQKHILVTGHGDGVIGIWDIRQEKSPVTLIDAHDSEVWQVGFHSLYPDNLFTCSQDGSCWFWDGTSMITGANYARSMQLEGGSIDLVQSDSNISNSIWLYMDANKHKMETFSLIPFNKAPVNCFDINGNKLICATDSDALIIVHHVPVHS